jgi:tetratricopeptide (TPR) repeat protein
MARNLRSTAERARLLRSEGWTFDRIARQFRDEYGVNSRVAYRLAHGLTQADVAARWNHHWPDPDVPKSAKQISYWEIWPEPGGRAPSLETLNRLAFLYQCQAGELLDGADHRDRDAAHRLDMSLGDEPGLTELDDQRLPALAVPARLSEATIVDLELRTDSLRKLDYREGAVKARGRVSAHLAHLLKLTDRAAANTVRTRVLRAAGDAAQLAAWLAIDGQRYDEGRRYCQLAVSLAEQGRDATLHAYALGVASYVHLHAGDGRGALRVLESARSVAGKGARPAVRSWLTEAAGEAYALAGQSRRGDLALTESERLFDQVTERNTPPWLAFFNSDCHAARLKGRCLTKLGRPRDAIGALYDALTLLPEHFVRERSGTLIDLALAQVQMKQIEQACATARLADTLARQTASERNRKRLRALLVDLMPWTSTPDVQHLFRQVLLN